MPATMEESPSTLDRIIARRSEIIQRFPNLWAQLISEWSAPGRADRLWLMYSANYLLRTGSLHWAIDPVRLSHRLRGAPDIEARKTCRLSPSLSSLTGMRTISTSG